jgi:hypothetical protein
MKHEYMQITVENMKKIAAVISVNNYSHFNALGFYTPVSRRAALCDWVWRAAGGHPRRFPHNNFSSVYRIFTKL